STARAAAWRRIPRDALVVVRGQPFALGALAVVSLLGGPRTLGALVRDGPERGGPIHGIERAQPGEGALDLGAVRELEGVPVRHAAARAVDHDRPDLGERTREPLEGHELG